MDKKDEALNLALEYITQSGFQTGINEVITAIREALAEQPRGEATLAQQQEPVAWVCHGVNDQHDVDFYENEINALPVGTMLYTSPPNVPPARASQSRSDVKPWVHATTWRGLTDEDILRTKSQFKGTLDVQFDKFAYAIEAAHGIKGTHEKITKRT